MSGTLSIVATPIGNLGDITLRALKTLKEADVIACEDTRVTSKLLSKYEIDKKPLVIYSAQNTRAGGARVLDLLEEGMRIALVTDAGTPGMSDPGAELVSRVRDELPKVRIDAIPGPSALVAAISIAGLPVHEFVFLGFLPNKKGRQTVLQEIAVEDRTVVFYESPHRILKALQSLADLAPQKRVAVARELTKVHEELVRGTAAEVADEFSARPTTTKKGEFVVIVSA